MWNPLCQTSFFVKVTLSSHGCIFRGIRHMFCDPLYAWRKFGNPSTINVVDLNLVILAVEQRNVKMWEGNLNAPSKTVILLYHSIIIIESSDCFETLNVWCIEGHLWFESWLLNNFLRQVKEKLLFIFTVIICMYFFPSLKSQISDCPWMHL